MKLIKSRLGVVVLVMIILAGVAAGCAGQKQADILPSPADGEAGGGYDPPDGPPDSPINGSFNGERPERPGFNLNDAASLLDMTADKLDTEMQSGKTMEQIVTEHGMSMEQFDEKMLEKRKAEIAQAVADGKMTQEQADNMLQNMGKKPDNNGPRQR